MSRVTEAQASDLVDKLCGIWPIPHLDESAYGFHVQAFVGSGLPYDALDAAIDHLVQTHQTTQRPAVAAIASIARSRTAPERKEYRFAGASQRVLDRSEMLYALADATDALLQARERYETRTGRSVRSTESGSMRHISSMLRIGPTTITGRPEGKALCEELLRRAADAAQH